MRSLALIVLFAFYSQGNPTVCSAKPWLSVHKITKHRNNGRTRLVSCSPATAAAKEEAEQADKQRREEEAALKKETEAKEGSATQDSTVTPEATVNTGSQSIVQVSAASIP